MKKHKNHDLLFLLAICSGALGLCVCYLVDARTQTKKVPGKIETIRLKYQEADSVFYLLDINSQRKILETMETYPNSRASEIALDQINFKVDSLRRLRTALKRNTLKKFALCNVFTKQEYDCITQDINRRVSRVLNSPRPYYVNGLLDIDYFFDTWGADWYQLDFYSGNLEDLIEVVMSLRTIERGLERDTIKVPQENPLIMARGDMLDENVWFTTPKAQELYEQFIRYFDYADSLYIWNNPEYSSYDSVYSATIYKAYKEREKLRAIKSIFDNEMRKVQQ